MRRYVVKSPVPNPGVTEGASYVGEIGVMEPVSLEHAWRAVSRESAEYVCGRIAAAWTAFAPWSVQPVDVVETLVEVEE